MFFRAHQDPAGSRSCRGTVLVDIRLAGFTHGGGSHQRRLALLMEILEMRLNTFGASIALRLRGLAEFRRVAHTSRAMTVTYCAKAEGIESCSNNAKVKVLAM